MDGPGVTGCWYEDQAISPDNHGEVDLTSSEPKSNASCPTATGEPTGEGVPHPVDENASGIAAAVAEIDAQMAENPQPEEPPPPEPQAWDGALPEPLMRVVDMRINLWQQLLRFDDKRTELRAKAEDRAAKSELMRQATELKRLPTPETLVQTLERISGKRGQLPKKPEPSEDDDTEPMSAEEYQELVTIHRASFDLGIAQNKILAARCGLDDGVIQSAAPLAEQEPLFDVCKVGHIDASALLGFTFFALGLEKRIAECKKAEKKHREQVRKAKKLLEEERAKATLIQKLRRKQATDDSELPTLDPNIPHKRKAAEKELAAIEPALDAAFWAVYEEIAWLYAKGTLDKDMSVVARALLRYGLVVKHPGLIDPAKAEFIYKDCADNVLEWDNSGDATHVAYADEQLKAVYQRKTPPSPDEDLDLNQRGSDIWRADRAWRQAVVSEVIMSLYAEKRSELDKDAGKLSLLVDKLQDQHNEIKGDQSQREQAVKVAKDLSDARRDLARIQQTIDRLDDRILPGVQNTANEAQARLASSGDMITPEFVIRREAKFIRRLARLAARLKTPYAQFVLRDFFEPEGSTYHSRAAVQEIVQKVEFADRFLFHQVIIPNKKMDRRITTRISPTFLLVPARGLMGISIAPRRSTDPGKLMLPVMGQRQEGLPSMALNIVADFGWDCCMEDIGADWIMADALCAGYAAVRWNYRGKKPETQKKAGFNKKNKDRQDWRGHYAMYVNSAEDAGRQLFYKCFEVYEVVAKYIGLPEGKERLRKD